MSRSSFERGYGEGQSNPGFVGLDKTGFGDVETEEHYIERDTLLEGDLLETSLEDYDDLLSIAQEDGFGFQE